MSETKVIHGFCVDKRGGSYFASPATDTNGLIECYDLSGFHGSIKPKDVIQFFECEGNTAFCHLAMSKADKLKIYLDNKQTGY